MHLQSILIHTGAAVACSNVLTASGDMYAVQAANTQSGGNDNLGTSDLVETWVSQCNATARQMDTDCAYLQGSPVVNQASVGSVQTTVYLSPDNSTNDKAFEACAIPLTVAWARQANATGLGAPPPGYAEDKKLGYILLGVSIGAAVASSIFACFSHNARKKRQRPPAYSQIRAPLPNLRGGPLASYDFAREATFANTWAALPPETHHHGHHPSSTVISSGDWGAPTHHHSGGGGYGGYDSGAGYSSYDSGGGFSGGGDSGGGGSW